MEKKPGNRSLKTTRSSKSKRPSVLSEYERTDRRIDTVMRWVWVYCIVGFIAMAGGLIASSTDMPGWFNSAIAFLGIVLRIALLVGVVALIVWWIRSRGQSVHSDSESGGKQSRIDFKNKPLQSAAALISGVVLLCAGPIAILYYFLLPTTFTASTELRSFYYVSVVPVVIAGIFFGSMILLAQDHGIASKEGKVFDRIVTLFSPVLFPLLTAFFWLLFVSGPLSYTLHLFSTKETEIVSERVARGTSSGVSDITCGGFWAAELHDHSFWWPRRVCNIDLNTMNTLRNGGTITLIGKVSRFGMDVDSYRL
jgi:hypothetical protein